MPPRGWSLISFLATPSWKKAPLAALHTDIQRSWLRLWVCPAENKRHLRWIHKLGARSPTAPLLPPAPFQVWLYQPSFECKPDLKRALGHLPPSPGALFCQDVVKSPAEQQGGEGPCLSSSSIVSMSATTTGQNMNSSIDQDDFVLVPNHIPSDETNDSINILGHSPRISRTPTEFS